MIELKNKFVRHSLLRTNWNEILNLSICYRNGYNNFCNKKYALCESNPLDSRLAVFVSGHFIVVSDFIDVSEWLDKLFVVCDDDEHKVLLVHSLLNYFSEGDTEASDVFLIQVGRWFIQSQDAEPWINIWFILLKCNLRPIKKFKLGSCYGRIYNLLRFGKTKGAALNEGFRNFNLKLEFGHAFSFKPGWRAVGHQWRTYTFATCRLSKFCRVPTGLTEIDTLA